MNKCEHGKAIVKFCMFEHCQSKQTGGCEDCIRKYHNHIGQISFLTEDDIKSIVKKFQIEANYRPKSRPLQESIFNFFTHIKTNISLNFDLACKNFINEIGYPYLQKNGTLSCYKRLKNKEYRKVTQKELKQLWQVYKGVDYNDIVKEEKVIYNEAVVKMEEMIDKLEKNVKEMFQNLTSMLSSTKSNGFYDRSYYLKINDIFKDIKKYPDINFPKTEIQKSVKKQIEKGVESPTRQKKLQRDTRDVSLDRQVKMQSRLKTQPVSKAQDHMISPTQQKRYKGADQRSRREIQRQERQRERQRGKRTPKYSAEMRPEDLMIKPNAKIQASMNYSQKEEQINERKRKLMEMMNSKSVKKVDLPQTKNTTLTPMRQKTSSHRLQIGDYIKESLTADRNMIGKDFSTPSNVAKYSKQQYSFKNTINSNKQSFTSKRAKTTYFEEDQEPAESKRQPRNQTLMSSQTQTESLFNAKIHIPIEDLKNEDEYQIKEESVQKCIFVPVAPETNTIARQIPDMLNQFQSPLLKKKKEIQNFSAFIKLAESKIIEEKEEKQSSPKASGTTREDEEKSFVKLNKFLEDSEIKTQTETQKAETKQSGKTQNQTSLKPKPSQKEEDSVQINDSEQMSLALLLKSLKLAGAQAIPYLQKAIQHASNNLSAAEYLSYLYLQTQRPQDCLKLCNDILKLISSSQSNSLALRLNINKSAALNYLGRYSETITFLQRCLRYRHNDILYKNLADAYYSVGILEKAIYNYEHAIIENSSNTQAHYNLAVCHYQQQNYYNASIYIDKAMKHQPNNEVYKELKKYNDEKIISNAI